MREPMSLFLTKNDETLTYAGIGSRDISMEEEKFIKDIASTLYEMGFVLRSGGADGSDAAFDDDLPPNAKEIYVPWNGFNNLPKNETIPMNQCKDAWDFLHKYHPSKGSSKVLSIGARKLLTRNTYQVLGGNLDKPSSFVICCASPYTMDYSKIKDVSGGTGQAVRIAYAYNIPVFNIRNPLHRLFLEDVLGFKETRKTLIEDPEAGLTGAWLYK